jgi:hypothetical protein
MCVCVCVCVCVHVRIYIYGRASVRQLLESCLAAMTSALAFGSAVTLARLEC